MIDKLDVKWYNVIRKFRKGSRTTSTLIGDQNGKNSNPYQKCGDRLSQWDYDILSSLSKRRKRILSC